MKTAACPIQLTLELDGEEYEISTRTGEYRSLMALLYDKVYTEGFGECRGMGRCGTCLVEITGNEGDLTQMNRNEKTTLSKTASAAAGMRLSCQIMVDEQLQGARVRVV